MVVTSNIPLASIHQQKSLRSTVTEALRSAILVGDLEEGRLYSAPQLAEPLGVSATPVREAMVDLVNEGLVVSVKNKGFRVTEVTDKDLREIIAVRQLLEAPAVRAITGRIPKSDFPLLREKADELIKAGARGDLRSYLTLDRDFHAALLQYTRNTQLEQICTRLRGRTRLRALRSLVVEGTLHESSLEHMLLLDHLESGDEQKAYELTLQHLGHASQLWARGKEESGSTRPLLFADLEASDVLPSFQTASSPMGDCQLEKAAKTSFHSGTPL
ncbi:GntR family transcriptional regulator [Nesterenkonia muleiensis]|uniref:GntR family transcriptional regulator n=1 Tax=Nesterenkonia muleiensis TaxID=2282648 RepID=UPI000E771A47|nr:GntR family transcriptional regulator [Nesterenkonia muleiensis]